MKKVLLGLVLLSILFSCSNVKDSNKQEGPDKIKSIEALIKSNAMGMDIGYQSGKLDTVKIITAQNSIKDLENRFEKPFDSLYTLFTGIYKNAQQEDNTNGYHIWKWEAERANELKAMQPSAVEYSIYKYTYTIKNLMNPKERTTIDNYYFFNGKDSLVGFYDDNDFKEIKLGYIKSELEPYEMAYGFLVTGLKK